ncbi:uncharacterized protein LOC128374032 [Scomber japonicus]|uniref:uncharacterized protein LOC128374032 n=1 Tax=Scomber japonicus TaxID=13676 RepID=UPI0023059BBA|nr:uncharacterized protein LOC128374032 [Scomber japonicus]
MEYPSLSCQVCLAEFKSFFDLTKHLRSTDHHQKMEEVFQKNVFKCYANIPTIVVVSPGFKYTTKQSIIGLSMLTVCFSPESSTFFYLCHICEEKCPSDRILNHLSSGDHSLNYFNYADPNGLSFSWMPSKNMNLTLSHRIKNALASRGPEQLQFLDLPEKLLEQCKTSTYSEVMHFFSENEKLLKLLEAGRPKRKMIQTYQKDGNRKHPLLGMQHLVECICVGKTGRRHFLCTLCNLTLAASMIIKHVLSFDHVFCYFKAWHPSTLLSKECYTINNNSFASAMLEFAKQTLEIHGTENADMKQVNLEPDVFTSVNFSCYAEALKKLEAITKENMEGSLVTSITPGKKLERTPVSSSSSSSSSSSYRLRCQDCNMIFMNTYQYFQHVFQGEHQQALKRLFGKANEEDGFNQTECVACEPYLGLYDHLKKRSREGRPVVGVSLVVTCLSTQDQSKSIYVCFACEASFPESCLIKHMDSRRHLIHTMLYQNPWQLPFGWKDHLDVAAMRSVASEEESRKGVSPLMVKILDVPIWMLNDLSPPSYRKVMERLELHYASLKRQVPPCETYSKLQENDRFPLLGKQFLVRHEVRFSHHRPTEMAFLCLLCAKRLSGDECDAHVFSWEHVVTFLKLFHPGSLKADTVNVETLLDLAKQAARIHGISHVQVIKLDKPIWEPCSYHTATNILACAKKREGKGKLKPPITNKKKLVPRETLNEVGKIPVGENNPKNSIIKEASETKTNKKSTDSSETGKNIEAEVDDEISNNSSNESGEKAVAAKETLPQSEKESEKGKEQFSKTSSDEMKNEVSEKCQKIKKEMEEPIKPTTRKPSEETRENCQNTSQGDAAETEKEGTTSKDALKNCMYQANERKRPRNTTVKPQDTGSDEHVDREMGKKRQRLTSKEDASCDESQITAGCGQREAITAVKEESCKSSQIDEVTSDEKQPGMKLWQYIKQKSRETVIGLGALFECNGDQRDPIYLCECCSLKIPEKDIICHVTGFDHQKMYLVGLQKVSPPQGDHWREEIRHLAALFEKDEGFGEAQVIDLDEENYNIISKQNFQAASQTVRGLVAQPDSGREIASTSTLSDVEPVGTSTLNAQHEFCFGMDNHEEVAMETDNSQDLEAQPSSVCVMTENTSKTKELPHDSNEVDVKMTCIKVPESADNTNSCPTASRSRKDTKRHLHLSKSGTNTHSVCIQIPQKPTPKLKSLQGQLWDD